MILKKTAASIIALFIAGSSIMPAFAFTEVNKGDWSGTTGVSTFNEREVARISKEELKPKESKDSPVATTSTESQQKSSDVDSNNFRQSGSVQPFESNLSSALVSMHDELLSTIFKIFPLMMIPFLLMIVFKVLTR